MSLHHRNTSPHYDKFWSIFLVLTKSKKVTAALRTNFLSKAKTQTYKKWCFNQHLLVAAIIRLSVWHSTSIIMLSYPSDWLSLTPGRCQKADSNLHRSLSRVPLHPPLLNHWMRRTSRRTGSGSFWSRSPDYLAPPLASQSPLKIQSHHVCPPGPLTPLRISPLSCPLGNPSCLPRDREREGEDHYLSLKPTNEF